MTAGRYLEGRSFLHTYDASHDPDGKVLETIMTAPLVVAHWISAQYYFSTVDPEAFGAGDKLLHNVVGDVGVIYGESGDLRVGLRSKARTSEPSGIINPFVCSPRFRRRSNGSSASSTTTRFSPPSWRIMDPHRRTRTPERTMVDSHTQAAAAERRS